MAEYALWDKVNISFNDLGASVLTSAPFQARRYHCGGIFRCLPSAKS